VLVALGVAGVLLGQTFGDQLFGEDEEPTVPGVEGGDGDADEALAVTGVTAFDPDGGDGEHDGEAPLAADGDVGTAWTSEEYSSPDFGGFDKRGVGLVIDLDGVTDLGRLVVDSPSTGWNAEVYVLDDPAADLESWGEPVAAQEGISGNPEFDLGGRSGGAVLLWITLLGEDGSIQVNEAGLSPA
jgi:hypothetical protein